MFKRIEKRRRKKVEEEELGLDEDLKEVLGMHDTDSDESDTDSESSNEDNGASEDQGLDRGSDGNPSGADDIDEQGGEDSTDAEEEGKPPISIREALRDPLYIIGLDPGLRACVVCPGKLLKNSKMVEIHRIAKAHNRRFKTFSEIAKDTKPDKIVWDLLQNQQRTSREVASAPSKRAQKRDARRNWQKLRQTKKKAKKGHQVAGVPSTIDASPKPRKKRKLVVQNDKDEFP